MEYTHEAGGRQRASRRRRESARGGRLLSAARRRVEQRAALVWDTTEPAGVAGRRLHQTRRQLVVHQTLSDRDRARFGAHSYF